MASSFTTAKAVPHESATIQFSRTIYTLPVELLAEIIIGTGADNRSAIGVLMGVSRRWYNTIINEPRLWNKASLNLGRSPSARMRAMRTARQCIERSGSLDLDITIRIIRDDAPCECYEDNDNPVCRQCVAWVDSHCGPIEMLVGSDGGHLARWRRLDVRSDLDSNDQQTVWIDRVLSPLIIGRPTPRLKALSFTGWFDVCLSFCHTPLLQEVTLRDAPQLHIANWGRVKTLSFASTPPRNLAENGAYTVMTRLILHMPICCPQLSFPNVVHLEILDHNDVNCSLELPALPRVQRILISTNMDDLLHHFPLHQYPTVEHLSLRFQSIIHNSRPTLLFISSLVEFLRSSCTNLEALDVDSSLLDTVKSKAMYLPNLKKLFLMGEELLPPDLLDT